jgi:hypothetical protein
MSAANFRTYPPEHLDVADLVFVGIIDILLVPVSNRDCLARGRIGWH